MSDTQNFYDEAVANFGQPIVDRVERALADGIFAQRPAVAVYSEDDHIMALADDGCEINLQELAAFVVMQKRFRDSA